MNAQEIKFEYTIFINEKPSVVWNYLVDPDLVKKYHFVPLKNAPRSVGDEMNYGSESKTLIYGKVTSFNLGKSIGHSFKFESSSHKGTENDGETNVLYEISDQNGFTELTLVHSGFKESDQTYANVTGGWPFILSNLKSVIETGRTLGK